VLRTGTTGELALALVRRRPWMVFFLLAWALEGKEALRSRVVEEAAFDPSALAYRGPFLTYLRREAASGRPICLVARAKSGIARAISNYLGLFSDVIEIEANGEPSGETVAKALQPLFSSAVFRVYTNRDVIGCELGGPLKNVIAISAGMAEGLSVGENTRAMVITRGLSEITRLGVALGGCAETFSGLTGLGDLLTTCMSPLSRNRQVGVQFAQGRTTAEIVASMNMVAEGIKTSSVVMELAAMHGVVMPIAAEVAAVVNGEHGAVQAFRGLRKLAAGAEDSAG